MRSWLSKHYGMIRMKDEFNAWDRFRLWLYMRLLVAMQRNVFKVCVTPEGYRVATLTRLSSKQYKC